MTDAELESLLEELEADLLSDVTAALALTAQDFADALDSATELVAARFSVTRIKDTWKRRTGGIMSRLKSIAGRGAKAAAEGVGDPLPDGWDKALDSYTAATQVLLDAVGDRLAADASQALAEGLNAGEDTEALKARLAAVFADDGSQLGASRAARIAATEATRAFNAGALAAAQALTGPDRPLVKQWLTRNDERVRAAHRDVNGQLRLLDEPFDVDGIPMLYPGDPTAPAALTVNCRCILKTATADRNARVASVAPEGDDMGREFDAAVAELQSRMPPQLKQYWLTGEGAAKIRWETPGSFKRCVRALKGDFPEDPEGLCANLQHEATGKWPGQNSGDVSAAADAHPGAMIALMPTEADAARLAMDGGVSADQLHLTLFYLGNAADWSAEQQGHLISRVSYAARLLSPVQGNVFGCSQWDVGSDEPAWVWNVGDAPLSDGSTLASAHFEATCALEDGYDDPELPHQHTPWSPHIRATYSADNQVDGMAAKTGPVTFDRLRVAFAGQYTDFPLTGGYPDQEPLADGPYQVGDRVRVTVDPHEPGQDAGTVEEINDGPAYGIVFDGMEDQGVHKWYVADELAPEEAAADGMMPQVLAWSTPGGAALAFEDQQTGDGRVFTPGSLYWGDGPWPLQYADEVGDGHEGARVAGVIQYMSRDGQRVAGSGVLYPMLEAGEEAATLLALGVPLGVSVDLDDVSMGLVDTSSDAQSFSAHLVTASVLPLPDGGFRLTGKGEQRWTACGAGTVGESSLVDIVADASGLVPAAAFEMTAAAGDGSGGGLVVEQRDSGTYLMRITRARIRGATLVSIPAYEGARIVLDVESVAAASVTASSAANDYDRVVRHVRKSLVPVTASDAARFLKVPIRDVRRHLARAAKKGHIVRITQGTYTAPVADTATASSHYATGVAELTASATGSVDLPVAARDAAWDGPAAEARVFEWAGGDCAKLDRAFAYRDDSAPCEEHRSRKLGFTDVVDGTLTIIPRGVFAAQAALEGARGGVDIPQGDVGAVRDKLAAVRTHVDEVTGGDGRNTMEASAWTAMKDLPAMPAAWFSDPTDLMAQGGPGVNYDSGRIYGWVAQAGEPHAGFAKKVTIDGLGHIDTTHFLRQRFTLDDGSEVKAGAFTMNVGHHRDGAECETSACQFDDTRTVAGIVTVGMSARGMWFSGAAAPWLSEWDRQVFAAVQPSYHMKKGPSGNWQLRAVLSVPVPGHSSPLLASAVVDRAQVALTAAATMAEVEEAVAAVQEPAPAAVPADIDYDRLADSMVAAMARAEQRKEAEAAELEALLAEGRDLDLS